MGTQFFVKTKINGKKLCVVKTREKIETKAFRTYLKTYFKKIEVKKNIRKYKKEDTNRCENIIYVVYKPVRTRKIRKNSENFREPVI